VKGSTQALEVCLEDWLLGCSRWDEELDPVGQLEEGGRERTLSGTHRGKTRGTPRAGAGGQHSQNLAVGGPAMQPHLEGASGPTPCMVGVPACWGFGLKTAGQVLGQAATVAHLDCQSLGWMMHLPTQLGGINGPQVGSCVLPT
jgi:hypothetical protein